MNIVNDQALERFNKDVDVIKNLKEFQKNQFYANQINHDKKVALKHDYKLNNSKEN